MGKLISSVFGSENESRDGDKGKAYQVDSRAYQYGGDQNEARRVADYYGDLGRGAQTRQAEQADYTQANYDRINAGQARASQQQVSDMMMSRAMGQTPSIAGMQANRQMNQLGRQSAADMQRAGAAQASAAASARGPAALALAQQGAANNTANMQGQIGSAAQMAGQNISEAAQVNAANERLQAEQAAFGAKSGMRGQDLGAMGQQAQMAQANAQLRAQQRAQNDQFQQGMTQNEMAVRMGQLNAGMNEQGQRSSNENTASTLNAQVAGQNAQTNQANSMAVVGGLSSLAGGAAGMAKGGPVSYGRPYLVGEKGPELVVPTEPGHVIPADKTKKLLGRAGGGAMVPWVNQPEPAAAPSTWGGGSAPAVDEQRLALDQEDARIAQAQAAHQQAEAYVDPYQRDVDRVRRLRAVSPDLVDDDDMRQLRVGKYMMRQKGQGKAPAEDPETAEKEAKTKKAVTEGKEAPPSLRSRLGGSMRSYGEQLTAGSRGVDTGLHISNSYVPPQLIPVSVPRWSGGEMHPIMGQGTGDYVMSGGGMNVLGTMKKMSANTNPMSIAREHGGPIVPMLRPAPMALRVPVGGPNALEKSPEQLKQEADAMLRAQQEQTIDLDDPRSHDQASLQRWADRDPESFDGWADRQGWSRNPAPPAARAIDLDDPASHNQASLQRWADRDPESFDNWADKQGWSRAPAAPVPTAMRDGAADPRVRSFDQTFHRDTPADQKRVKRGVEDKAAKEADEMMASFKRRSGEGSSLAKAIGRSKK
jgi:hypothetical protein